MGALRETFYRYQCARDESGVDALPDRSRRKRNVRNREESQIEAAVLEFALEYPAHGQVRVIYRRCSACRAQIITIPFA